MRFRILGPLEVLSPEGWTDIRAPKWRSLLACLLLRPGQLVPTDNLIQELWGDTPPGTANNLVSIYVHQLKKVIGDKDRRVIVYRAPGYMLRVAPGDLDLQVFESLAAEGRDALDKADLERAVARLTEALALWRGPLLGDVPPTPLLESHARRVAELWVSATELRIEADLVCGRAGQVIPELSALVTEYPLRERLWVLLVRALEEAGRRAEALDAYARAREVIADALGVDPGNELQRLYAGLLAADAASPPAVKGKQRRAGVSQAVGGNTGQSPAAGREATAGDDTGAGTGQAVSEPPGTIAVGNVDGAVLAGVEEAEADRPPEPAADWPRPAQLPADIGDFTGRERHVAQLCGLLAGTTQGSPGAVRVVVVSGAAGLGKTTLAVHAAHEVHAQFPDGQLYVDLQGASSQAAAPEEVLARFLREFGVPGDKIPARADERAALYRTTLAGRRVLVVLDNAMDSAQIKPLLPGSSSCAVLVTTRNRTSDLASTRFVDLNVLEDDEALALFSRIVGEERAAAEPDATGEILVACAGLPLAIRICAARLAKRQQWRIATLADRLRNQHRRLDELKTGDLAVRASFQVSYDALRPATAGGVDPARVFRLLGLWQGERISGVAAAALIGEPEDDIAEALETLVDVNLLDSPAPDCYRLHDLLRVFAVERAQAEEAESVRAAAVARLMLWYLDSAEAAADVVSPQRYKVPRETTAPSSRPLAFASLEEALAWCGDERANLVAATRQAAAAGLHDIAWRLPPTLSPVFSRWSNWVDRVATNRVALESARQAGHRVGEAWVLNQLGWALASIREEEAFDCLKQALSIRRALGDTEGEAQTAMGLAAGYLYVLGPGEDALRYMQLAVDLLRPAGPTSMYAAALNNLGEVYFGRDDLAAAEECYVAARDICRRIGGHVEGHVLHNLARVYQLQGRRAEAVASYSAALGKHRAAGALFGEAMTLKHLGETYAETRDSDRARASWQAALRIFQQIGDAAEAAETATLLSSRAVRGDGEDTSGLSPTISRHPLISEPVSH